MQGMLRHETTMSVALQAAQEQDISRQHIVVSPNGRINSKGITAQVEQNSAPTTSEKDTTTHGSDGDVDADNMLQDIVTASPEQQATTSTTGGDYRSGITQENVLQIAPANVDDITTLRNLSLDQPQQEPITGATRAYDLNTGHGNFGSRLKLPKVGFYVSLVLFFLY